MQKLNTKCQKSSIVAGRALGQKASGEPSTWLPLELRAGGEPSTKFPPEWLVEQAPLKNPTF